MTTRVSRPSQAAILYSLLPIFSFRAWGHFRKEKGARYTLAGSAPLCFALLYDVSGVPPKDPPIRERKAPVRIPLLPGPPFLCRRSCHHPSCCSTTAPNAANDFALPLGGPFPSGSALIRTSISLSKTKGIVCEKQYEVLRIRAGYSNTARISF